VTTKAWYAFDEYLCLGGFGVVEHEHRFHPTVLRRAA
jgi:hypothetical protein